MPAFDVLMLGIGGEGHTASVFPGSPAVHETDRSVVAVHDCPKPPPTQVSLTLPATRRSAEVWIMTTARPRRTRWPGRSAAPQVELPVAGARGRRHTRWLLDRTAAGQLSPDLVPTIR